MIFSAIGAAVAGIGGLLSSTMLAGGIGSLLLKAAVGIGLNLAAQALAGKPEGPSFAIQGQLQSGGDVPRAFPLGYTATAGSLVYANTWGSEKKTPNAYLTQVIALSDLPINSLVGLWVNGEKVTIDWNDTSYGSRGYPVKEYWTGPGGNHMWVKFYDGTQTAADSFLVNTVSSAERPYQSTRVGYGVAYAVVTTQINEELFTGFPQFKFEVYGLKLYDVTKDSTAGGSGTHRWSDPSTWGGDGDHLPAVQLYNLWRGLSYGGKWLYGLQGVTTARLPAAHWRAQIQKCRAVIKSGGANVATYRSGAEIAVSAPLGDASEALLTSCQGRMSEAGGVYKVFVGAPGLPVASFTDGEIISTEEQSFTPFFGLADSINGIAGKHPNPAEAWNVKVAPPIYRADLEAKDGNRRLMADVSFDFVPYADQVQRLMKSALEEAQRARRHTFVLPPEYWILEAGDVVSWTSARNGYVNKLFRVDGVIDRANLDVMIDVTEIDPADYDWDDDTDYRVPVDGPVGIIRPTPQPIIDWFAEGAVIDGGDGKRRAGIRLEWDGDQVDVEAVQFEVRRRSDLVRVYTGRTDNVEAGAILISQNLFSLTDYGVRGRYIPRSDRSTLWSDWLPVTTPDQPYTDIDVIVANLSKEIRDLVERNNRQMDEVRERIEFLAANTGSANIEDIVERQSFVKEFGRTKALIVKESGERVSENAALAYDIVLLDTRIEDAEGLIAGQASVISEMRTEVTDLDGQVSAMSSMMTFVSAQAAQGSADGMMQWKAEAGPAGYTVSYAVQGRVNASGAWRYGGMSLDVGPNGARWRFIGDQIVLADSSGNVFALFRPGTNYLNNAIIRNLDATNITAAKIDAKLILQNGTVIEDLINVDAFSRFEPLTYSFTRSTNFDDGAWRHRGTLIVNVPAGKPFIEFVDLTAISTRSGSNTTCDAYIVVKRNGNSSSVSAGELFGEARSQAGAGTVSDSRNVMRRISGASTVRYDIWTWNTLQTSANQTGSVTVKCDSGIWVFT